MSLDWDVLSLKFWWEHSDGGGHKPLDIWKAFLGLVTGQNLNLIIICVEVIIEGL